MTLRRGFKTEANTIAGQVRTELGLRAWAPLDPRKLADLLAIPLLPLSTFRAVAPDAVEHFAIGEPEAFSAVTVFRGPSRLIVFNDSHSPGRQASDLAHELAHALLQHPPHSAFDEYGCRIWAADCEDEANWLAGALLVSDAAALSIVRRRLPLAQAAIEYGVSAKMMQFRLNVTAAVRRVSRTGRT